VASKKIQGITIEIGGSTVGLQKSLKEVDKASSNTTKELGKINRALKFDDGNQVLLSQKFEVLQDAISNTSKRLDSLKQAQSEVDRMFSAGEIDASAYREFQRELQITENKLEHFKKQADDVKAKISVQVDDSAFDKIKSELNSLSNEAKQTGREIGQALAAGATAGAAAFAGITLGMQETNQQLGMLKVQASQAGSNISSGIKKMSDEQLSAMQDGLKKQEDALEESLSDRYDAIVDSYDKQKDELDHALDAEYRAFEKASDKKIELIDKEYTERLKLIDEEKYNQIKAIEVQIDGLNDLTEAENKAARDKENAEKRTSLVSAIENARTSKKKEAALKALADFDEKLRLETIQSERKAQIESLRDQKDLVSDEFEKKKQAIEDEYDLKKKAAQDEIDLQADRLREEHSQAKEALDKRIDSQLKAVQKAHAVELESFKQMTDEKLEIAKKPVQVSTVADVPKVDDQKIGVSFDLDDIEKARVQFASVGQDINQTTEAVGNLIRAGYDSAEGINDISESLAGAVVRYGETFNVEGLAESIGTTTQLGEATGQFLDLLEKEGVSVDDFNSKMQSMSSAQERADYIAQLLADQGLSSMYQKYTELNPEVVKAAEEQLKLQTALADLAVVLSPLITKIVEFITSLVNWANENPIVAKTLAILTAAIAGVSGAIVIITPLFTFIKEILPIVTKLFGGLSKMLPGLGGAFTALSGPIGWIIAAVGILISLAPTLIENWDSIKGFFIDLWDKVVNAFKNAKKSISETFKAIGNAAKGPLNSMIKMINTIIRGLNKIEIPEWVPKIGGESLNIPEIPMLAKGTQYFRGGSAIVGENGPELVTMPFGAKVYPNNKTQEMLQGNININVSSLVVREESDVKKIARELYNLQRKKGRGAGFA